MRRDRCSHQAQLEFLCVRVEATYYYTLRRSCWLYPGRVPGYSGVRSRFATDEVPLFHVIQGCAGRDELGPWRNAALPSSGAQGAASSRAHETAAQVLDPFG